MSKASEAAMLAKRTTLLTPEVAEEACALVRAGTPMRIIADAVGVHAATLSSWVAQGRFENAVEPFAEFSKAFLAARAEHALERLETVHEAAASSAKWAAWELEKLHPESFGKDGGPTVIVENHQSEGAPVVIDVTARSEELERQVRALSKGSK